jgi:mRNA interferase RelE/StbE
MYRVVYKPAAGRDVDKLPRHVLPDLRDAVAALAVNPRPHGCRKLRGASGLWRIRVGVYRVVYEIDDSAHVVRIARAGHRREIYQ